MEKKNKENRSHLYFLISAVELQLKKPLQSKPLQQSSVPDAEVFSAQETETVSIPPPPPPLQFFPCLSFLSSYSVSLFSKFFLLTHLVILSSVSNFFFLSPWPSLCWYVHHYHWFTYFVCIVAYYFFFSFLLIGHTKKETEIQKGRQTEITQCKQSKHNIVS